MNRIHRWIAGLVLLLSDGASAAGPIPFDFYYLENHPYQNSLHSLHESLQQSKPTEIKMRVEKTTYLNFKILKRIGHGVWCNVYLAEVDGVKTAIRLPKSLSVQRGITVHEQMAWYRKGFDLLKVEVPGAQVVELLPLKYPGQGKYFDLTRFIEGRQTTFKEYVWKILEGGLLESLLNRTATVPQLKMWDSMISGLKTFSGVTSVYDFHSDNFSHHTSDQKWKLMDTAVFEGAEVAKNSLPAKAITDRTIIQNLILGLFTKEANRVKGKDFFHRHIVRIKRLEIYLTEELRKERRLKFPTLPELTKAKWYDASRRIGRVGMGAIGLFGLMQFIPKLNPMAEEIGVPCEDAKRLQKLFRCESYRLTLGETICDYIHGHWENPKEKRACGLLYYRAVFDHKKISSSTKVALKKLVEAGEKYSGTHLSLPKEVSASEGLQRELKRRFDKDAPTVERVFYNPQNSFEQGLLPSLESLPDL